MYMCLKVMIRPCSRFLFSFCKSVHSHVILQQLKAAYGRPSQPPRITVNCCEDKAVAWEPDRTVILHSTPIMGFSFLPFTSNRLNGTKLFIILPLLTSACIPALPENGCHPTNTTAQSSFKGKITKLIETFLCILSLPTGANKSSAGINDLFAQTQLKHPSKMWK